MCTIVFFGQVGFLIDPPLPSPTHRPKVCFVWLHAPLHDLLFCPTPALLKSQNFVPYFNLKL